MTAIVNYDYSLPNRIMHEAVICLLDYMLVKVMI